MIKGSKDPTTVVHAGRHPERYIGVVNPPVMHATTPAGLQVDFSPRSQLRALT
jgi:hypothetical protein